MVVASGVEPPAVMHRVQVLHMDGFQQLEETAEHLLPKARVDGEHGVGDRGQGSAAGRAVAVGIGKVVADVAQDGEVEFFHLVVGHLDEVSIAGVRGGREAPVVAVAGMEEGGAVAEGEEGADSHIGGVVGLELEMRGVDALAKTQHGKGQTLVDATSADGVVGGENVPIGVLGAPLGDVGVVVVLVEMGDDEVDLFARGPVQEGGEEPLRVTPIVEDYQAVLFFSHETAVVDVV